MTNLWASYRNTYSGLPRSAWLLAGAQFVNASGTMVIFFLTLYLTTKMGLTLERAGQVMGGYGVGMLAGTIAGGGLSDRLGAHRVQRFSLAGNALCLAALSFAEGFGSFLGVSLLWGFFAAALWPANASAMAEICAEPIRAKGFVLSRLANNLGATVGPVLGGFLVQRDYRFLFWVDAATCVLAAAALLLFFPESSPPRAPAAEKQAGGAWWRDGALLVILASALGTALVFSQLFSTFAPYLRQSCGLAEPNIGALMAVNTVLIVLFQMPLIHAAQGLSRTVAAAAGALFIAAGFGLMPLGTGMGYLAFTVAVWTLGEMLSFPTFSTLVSVRAPAESQGKYQGLYSLTFSIGIVAGPALGARLSQRAGWDALWWSAAAAALLVGALMFLLSLRWDGKEAQAG